MSKQTIVYTHTDEAPALATRSFLPIARAFVSQANVDFEIADISLAGRVLATFSKFLEENQKIEDDLARLGEWVNAPEANIIKLPNISASMPQLKATIAELQKKGYALPDYPENPQSETEQEIKALYDRVKGSAVNPVLREGNSDRRAPKAVKNFAKKYPHSMGEWTKDSRSHVATMQSGDFFHNEQSLTLDKPTKVRFVLTDNAGKSQELRAPLQLEEGEIIDATFLSQNALVDFLKAQIEDAKAQNVLFSLHLKATMMKISDPIIFGHAVRVFFAPVFEQYGDVLAQAGINANDGLGQLLNALAQLDEDTRAQIEQVIEKTYAQRPDLAMVDSDKGITNLHVPSDVIVDASMPAMIRNSGQMWNKEGKTQDTKAVIPDSSYAGVYQAVIEFCREHGAFDPATMGSVPNVGLMAKKAEEYGSHDKTFSIPFAGKMEIIAEDGKVLTSHEVEKGDIWRACQTKDAPVKDWVELAVRRARLSSTPAIFWLDEKRPHDAQLIAKVKRYLSELDLQALEIDILPPEQACLRSLERMKAGKDTISVSGNVLRDYLTDLFPILELGTSAKMLSIVPLMNGGGLFETGAGGSAPKHVQQFVKENHLRWDSLGEFLALTVSLEHLAQTTGNDKAEILAQALDQAIEALLLNNQSPKRKAGELDNRGSHFYLALHWAKALAEQNKDSALQQSFTQLAQDLADNEQKIVQELSEKAGESVDLGGYYAPDESLARKAMRPSKTLNALIEAL